MENFKLQTKKPQTQYVYLYNTVQIAGKLEYITV